MQEQSNKSMIAGILAVTMLIFVGLAWIILRAPAGQDSTKRDENVSFSDAQDPATGPIDAKVVVHAYSDFQCPACQIAEPGFAYAKQTFGDRVRFVWKDFPLSQIHKNAEAAASAARCAQAQGKFWEFHDLLYAYQARWSPLPDPQSAFVEYAKAVGLDGERFRACYDVRAHASLVRANYTEGVLNRVDSTPTFFINQKRFFAMSSADWDARLREALDLPLLPASFATSTNL